MAVRIPAGAEPGHSLTAGYDERHFMGRCAECDAYYLARLSLAQVEDYAREGRIGYDQLEAYQHAWATASYHYGDYRRWEAVPTDPAVLEHVRLIRAAFAHRTATEETK